MFKCKQSRSRILAIQKKTLVNLIKNFFVRYVGHHRNVNFNDIGPLGWEKFAKILNSLGPAKAAIHWKNVIQNFHDMLNKSVTTILISVVSGHGKPNS